MINNVALNSQTLRTDLQSVKNAPKQLSKLAFKGEEDEFETSKPEVSQAPARKFSFNKALGKFGDGFIYPIRQAFNSATSAAVTLTSLVVVRNILKKVPELGKPLVAITAGLGLYNIGKGLLNIAKNKNNPEAQEESFVDIGKGTAITALAGKCANGALNAGKDPALAVVSTSKLSWGKDILGCVKESPAALMSSYKTISANPKEILNAVLPVLPNNIKEGLEAFSPGVATATDLNIDSSAADPNGIGAEGLLTVVQDKLQMKKTENSEQ